VRGLGIFLPEGFQKGEEVALDRRGRAARFAVHRDPRRRALQSAALMRRYAVAGRLLGN
jgi:hypothetical protein